MIKAAASQYNGGEELSEMLPFVESVNCNSPQSAPRSIYHTGEDPRVCDQLNMNHMGQILYALNCRKLDLEDIHEHC